MPRYQLSIFDNYGSGAWELLGAPFEAGSRRAAIESIVPEPLKHYSADEPGEDRNTTPTFMVGEDGSLVETDFSS